MTAPRLEIDLGKLRHNARTLVERLQTRGIAVTGVTKAVCGSAEIANVMLAAGVNGLGDSRVENIAAMRRLRVPGPITLIRSPMISQADLVVRCAETSFNTELDVVAALSTAAAQAGRVHGIVLMVELGDLREGIMPADLEGVARGRLAFLEPRRSRIECGERLGRPLPKCVVSEFLRQLLRLACELLLA